MLPVGARAKAKHECHEERLYMAKQAGHVALVNSTRVQMTLIGLQGSCELYLPRIPGNTLAQVGRREWLKHNNLAATRLESSG